MPAFFLQIAAGVVAGLVSFLASRAGALLAGFGLTIIGVKSFEVFLGYLITDIDALVSMISSGGGGGSGYGALFGYFIQVAAYCGLFDAINIIISGYMASASLIGVKIMLGRAVARTPGG